MSPPFKDYVLSINIAEGLSRGTYSFSPESKQVRLFFFHILEGFVWSAESGTVTFNSIPDFEAIKGKLSGTFNFVGTAELGDGSQLVLRADNGSFNLEQ
ncbi:hypothetical protein [Pseudomonas veronii]|uniref:hypothetical protein n=1 Tax=Pseudomonas veronii TaxID=76761 RepID=UPI0021C1392F|nr:hypothetical protein [Pseudomonas veronii]MCT9825747.1 hypothetical protein [Pseudomonas veronii]